MASPSYSLRLRTASLLRAAAAAVLAVLLSLQAAPGQSRGLAKVVIDPGHGGKDPGTLSLDGKTKEKDLTLAISKELRRLIQANYPGVKVVMTREDDTFVPLYERADIANKAKADLFVSIHINASSSRSARGFSVHVMGNGSKGTLYTSNSELTKRENSVITLEDDYKTRYEGFDPDDPSSAILFELENDANLENSILFAEGVAEAMDGMTISRSRGVSQNGFLVLWRTTMPSALIECGFMTNSADLTILRTEAGCKGVAKDIFEGFASYKKKYDRSMSAVTAGAGPAVPKPANKPTAVAKPSGKTDQVAKPSSGGGKAGSSAKPAKPEKVDPAGTFYGTQVLATGRQMDPSDKFFKGYTPVELHSGKLYRYIVGASRDLDTARSLNKQIREKFPESFLARISEGKTERVR